MGDRGIVVRFSVEMLDFLKIGLVHREYIYSVLFFCGAAAQRGPWPPHS